MAKRKASKKRKKKVSKLVKQKVVAKERTIECVDCNRSVRVKRYKGRVAIYRCAKCRAFKTRTSINDKGQYVSAGKENSERTTKCEQSTVNTK